MISLLLTLTILNFFIIFFFDKISIFLNLFDYPDQTRKLHLKPIAAIGGFIVLVNLLVFFLFFSLNNNYSYYILRYFSAQEFKIFYTFSIIFFFTGYLDDKFKISANVKLILHSILIYLLVIFSNDLLLKSINFSYFFGSINILNISTFLTILCFLLFINAFNMFDGINLQAASYAIFIFILFILNKIFILLSIVIIIALLVFVFFNYKNKCFLGNSGSLLISFIIAYLFIKSASYNNVFFADQIFLIMAIPGFDLFRLAFQRILQHKHPFHADKNHIHHILLFKFGLFKTLIILLGLIIIPNILSFYFGYYFLFIFISLVFYLFVIYKYHYKA